MLVGFGAGGGTDIVSRIIAVPLGEVLHQSVIVENKIGAGGTIAAETVARADKDGYTALMTSPAHTVSAAMLKAVPYDAGQGLRAGLLGRRLPPSSSSRKRIFRPTTSRA